MAHINLLPWREAERKRRQRDFGTLLAASLALTVLLAFFARMQIEGVIEHQDSRNAFLDQQIKHLEQQIREIKDLEETKADIIARMNVIQRLQASRPEIVHLFDEAVITIPDGVVLTKMTQSGDTVTLEGRAQSNARVSAFMRSIEASEWLGKARLKVIEHKDKTGTGLSHFTLQLKQIKTESSAQDGHSTA